MTTQRARVVVADDHDFFRDGLVRGLQTSAYLRVVGEAVSGRETLDLLRTQQPDVAVVDYRMPDLDGIDVMHAVSRDALPTRVLMLSAEHEGPVVFRALQEGACGYLSKDARRAEIVEAVHRVWRGETVIPGELAAGLASQIQRTAQPADGGLTGRERRVLAGFARGQSVPDLAAEYYLAVSTVKTHAQRLYEKLGVSDRAAAVAEGMRRGLLE